MKKNLLFALAVAVLLPLVSCNENTTYEAPPLLEATYSAGDISSNGGVATFTLKANQAWEITNTDTWIKRISPTSGDGNKQILVTFEANRTAAVRSADFVIKSGELEETLTIEQSAVPETLYLSYSSPKVVATGGTATFYVKSNTSWTVSPNSDTWISNITPTSGNGDGTVSVTFAGITSTNPRTSVFTVKAGTLTKTVSITQKGGIVPAKPGEITVSNVTSASATLTIAAIPSTSTYKWYKDGVEVSNTSSRTYTATADGTYKVAGVNAYGEGAASPNKIVELGDAPAAAGTITETDLTPSSVVLNIAEITGATTYKWYLNGTEVQNTSSRTYTATKNGTYKVAGVNKFGEGTASPNHTVALEEGGEDTLNFTDITASTVAASGTPSGLAGSAGPTTWDTTLTPGSDGEYYGIGLWASYNANKISVFIDFVDGALKTDNYSNIANNTTYPTGTWDAFYIDNEGLLNFLADPWPIAYDKATRTMDFSGKYDGNTVYLGVVGHNTTSNVGLFTEGYADAKLVLTPTSGAPAVMMTGGKKLETVYNEETGMYEIPGIKGVKYVNFDPAKFSRE